LLEHIRDIKNPVVLAGDLNTSTHEGMPIGLKRLLRERFGSGKWWAKEAAAEAVEYATPVGWAYQLSHSLFGFARQIDDPTARSIPLIGENPEAKFFTTLEHFRFSDGGEFDFSGDKSDAWEDRSGKLANSNERGKKGFVSTEELDRTYGPVGAYKLDWIFVKPPATAGGGELAPHLGRTMRRLNHSIPGRISDHSAITVTLPLQGPGHTDQVSAAR